MVGVLLHLYLYLGMVGVGLGIVGLGIVGLGIVWLELGWSWAGVGLEYG